MVYTHICTYIFLKYNIFCQSCFVRQYCPRVNSIQFSSTPNTQYTISNCERDQIYSFCIFQFESKILLVGYWLSFLQKCHNFLHSLLLFPIIFEVCSWYLLRPLHIKEEKTVLRLKKFVNLLINSQCSKNGKIGLFILMHFLFIFLKTFTMTTFFFPREKDYFASFCIVEHGSMACQ